MKRLLILLFCLQILTSGYSQDTHLSSVGGESSFGIGVGLPYGAIGARFGINLTDYFNLFGGLGYQFSGVGYNVGLLKDFSSSSMSQFYLVGMYGTNAAIRVKGLSELDKLYRGVTFGAGIKINSRMTEGNFWDLGLLVPMRSSDFKDDETAVKNDPRISEFNSAWPVLIVIGYNFNL